MATILLYGCVSTFDGAKGTIKRGKSQKTFELFRALVPSTEPKVRLSEGKAKFWSSESKDMLAWFLLSRDKIQPKVKKLLAFPSNELGNTQNEAPNNVFPKPPAWKVHNHPAPSLA